FLIVTDEATANMLTDKLRGEAELNNSQQWLALNIEAGFPVIDAANSGQFIPQATNLQALGGISFKKGCYTGQEMVARAKFRGANKRALWLLTGSASRLPEAGEDLELKMGENWQIGRASCRERGESTGEAEWGAREAETGSSASTKRVRTGA